MKAFASLSLMLLIAGSLFTSCKKSDPSLQSLIVDEWQVTVWSTDGENQITSDPDYEYDVKIDFQADLDLLLTGTETEVATGDTETIAYLGSYTIMDDGDFTMQLVIDGDTTDIAGSAQIENDQLNITATYTDDFGDSGPFLLEAHRAE